MYLAQLNPASSRRSPGCGGTSVPLAGVGSRARRGPGARSTQGGRTLVFAGRQRVGEPRSRRVEGAPMEAVLRFGVFTGSVCVMRGRGAKGEEREPGRQAKGR